MSTPHFSAPRTHTPTEGERKVLRQQWAKMERDVGLVAAHYARHCLGTGLIKFKQQFAPKWVHVGECIWVEIRRVLFCMLLLLARSCWHTQSEWFIISCTCSLGVPADCMYGAQSQKLNALNVSVHIASTLFITEWCRPVQIGICNESGETEGGWEGGALHLQEPVLSHTLIV
jgi:hypothetical protein